MRRFPTRTLVLMLCAVLAFLWMYWQTHSSAPAHPVRGQVVEIIQLQGGDR